MTNPLPTPPIEDTPQLAGVGGQSSLRTRLVWLVMVALVPVFVLVTYTSLKSQGETVARARADLLRVVRLSALGEQQTVDGTQRLLSAIASGPSLKQDDLKALCPQFLANIRDSSGAYTNLGFVTVEGELACAASRALDASPIRVDDVVRTVLSRWTFSVGRYEPPTDTVPPSISFALPVYSEAGQLRGAVVAVLKLRELLVGRTQDASFRVSVALVDRNGTVLGADAAPVQVVGKPYAGQSFANLLSTADADKSFSYGMPYALDAIDDEGQAHFYALQALSVGSAPGLYVIASVRQVDVVAPAQKRMALQIGLLVLLTALGMAVAYWLGNRMLVRPTRRLLQDIRALGGAANDRSAVDDHPKDEIAALSMAFAQTAAALEAKDAQRDHMQSKLLRSLVKQQATEQLLRASQGMLHMASTISRVGAWQIDMPEARLVWSPQVYAIYELGDDFQPDMTNSTEFYAPEYRDLIRERFDHCVATGSPIDVELQLITGRQHRLWVRMTGEAVIDASGTVTRVQGAIQDISDQKQSQARELALARRLSNTLESISQGLITYDRDWRVTYVNAEAEKLIGRQRSELLDRSVWDEFPELVNSPIALRYRSVVHTRQPAHFEEFYAPLNLWLQMSLYPSEEGLAVYFRDVTQRRADDAHLRLLENAVSRINEIVVITEADPIDPPKSRIVYVNDAFEKSTGYSRDEVVGKSPSMLQGPGTDRRELDRIRHALIHWEPVRAELLNYTKSGAAYWIDLEMVPIKDAVGTVTHWVAVERDVTERKAAVGEILRLNSELEARVLKRTAQLQAVNKELEAFAYSVSHDLRAPLNTINGFSGLLDKVEAKTFTDKGRHYLNRIRAGASQMGELIDGLLVLARNSSETLQRCEVDLTALAERVVHECQEREPDRVVAVQVTPGLMVQADAMLMYVVLHNLIGNAWKFSAKVQAAAIAVGSDTGADGQAVYFVRDNGAGFDASQADNLFGIFQRLHSPSEYPGTGIGLANVKRVVERHGGRVWAHSVVDEGATFYFTLS